MSQTENKKKKRKINYTLMLFVDSKEGRIRQMGIGPTVVESVAAVVVSVIAILLIVGRTYVKIGTLLCMLCGGPIIDFFTIILSPLFSAAHPVWIDYCVEVVACVILAFGMTIVIKSDAGTGPNDLVAVVISDKLHRKFSVVRILTDLTFVIVGFLLGGSFGIGTLICAFLVGPVAGFFLPYSERYINRIVGER